MLVGKSKGRVTVKNRWRMRRVRKKGKIIQGNCNRSSGCVVWPQENCIELRKRAFYVNENIFLPLVKLPPKFRFARSKIELL